MTSLFTTALKSVRHNWFSNGFSTIALAAVLAPLLVLYGLKLGIVTGLLEELRRDPGMRRIGLSGYQPLTESEVEAIRKIAGVGFVVGSPRSIAARVEMRREDGDGMEAVTADWLPSGEGEPLMPANSKPVSRDEAILSEALALKLGVAKGDTVIATVYRNQQSEIYEFPLTVGLVLARHALAGERALVAVERLNLIAGFLDGFAIPEEDIDGRPPEERAALYDSVRLYASTIDDVFPVERAVAETYGFRTSSEAASIQWVRDLEQVMGSVFLVVSAAGVIGYVVSLWATIAGSVRASRGQLSLLRLLGVRGRALWIFPVVQVMVITTFGLGWSFVFSLSAGQLMNRLFLPDMFNGGIFNLGPSELAATAALSYGVAVVVALWQLSTLSAISPTEALAENLSG